MSNWTQGDVDAIRQKQDKAKAPKRSKYGAVKTVVDNITFDSAKEAQRYVQLTMMQKAGLIRGLQIQPRFVLNAAGPDGPVACGEYRADFEYFDLKACAIVREDVKSSATRTPLYRLKKRIVEACHAITITEV